MKKFHISWKIQVFSTVNHLQQTKAFNTKSTFVCIESLLPPITCPCLFNQQSNFFYLSKSGGTPPSTDLRPWWHALIALLTLYMLSFFVGAILFCLRAYYFRSPPSDRYYSSPSPASRQKRS